MLPIGHQDVQCERGGPHATNKQASGMRYHFVTTISCGSLQHMPQHLVDLTESHVGGPLFGTSALIWPLNPYGGVNHAGTVRATVPRENRRLGRQLPFEREVGRADRTAALQLMT
jgi:hypothetical protein